MQDQDKKRRVSRYPRYKRSRTVRPPLWLQPRDLEIIKLVHHYRLLRSDHIQALVDGSSQVILRRLQRLFHHGYLDRPLAQFIQAFGSQKFVYALGNKGADILAERYGIDRGKIDWSSKNSQVKQVQLAHSIMISDFHACLTLALKQRPDVQFLFWQQPVRPDHVTLNEDGKEVKVPIIPDAYLSLEDSRGKMYFFLEADQSTMTNSRFLRKLKGYWHYWKQRKHTQRYGVKTFRVLTICKTERRRENLRKVAEKAFPDGRGSALFWFTSEEGYSLQDPAAVLGEIWQIPGDHCQHSILE